jgi:hypothetical protein
MDKHPVCKVEETKHLRKKKKPLIESINEISIQRMKRLKSKLQDKIASYLKFTICLVNSMQRMIEMIIAS